MYTCSQALDVFTSHKAHIFRSYLADCWHVLLEVAPVSEWDELFIDTNVSEQQLQTMRPTIPYLAEGRQLVIMGSGKLVIKTQHPADLMKSLVGHDSLENVPSGFFTPEAEGRFGRHQPK